MNQVDRDTTTEVDAYGNIIAGTTVPAITHEEYLEERQADEAGHKHNSR